MPMKNPPHPGEFIQAEIIEAAGLTATAAAKAWRVSRPTLSSLLNGKAGLSGEMALRIEKAFGVKMDSLMRMQSSYDIARRASARSRSGCRAFPCWPPITLTPLMRDEVVRQYRHRHGEQFSFPPFA